MLLLQLLGENVGIVHWRLNHTLISSLDSILSVGSSQRARLEGSTLELLTDRVLVMVMGAIDVNALRIKVVTSVLLHLIHGAWILGFIVHFEEGVIRLEGQIPGSVCEWNFRYTWLPFDCAQGEIGFESIVVPI